MPELPEVETIVRVLEKSLIGEQVKKIRLFYKPLLETTSPYPLSVLEGAKFQSFDRRGKFLIFSFSNGKSWVLHLRMEGKFHLYDKEMPFDKHTHLWIETENHQVHYLDTRKFSRMAVVDDLDEYFIDKNLGVEPFSAEFTAKHLYDGIHNSKRAIKALLLDQKIVVGIGNIYADEILFASKVHPETMGAKVSKHKAKEIFENTKSVLDAAIKQGGTTVRSYTSSLNVHGRFQVALNAYGQFGKPCANCGSILRKTKVSGRTSVYCGKCQKVKR